MSGSGGFCSTGNIRQCLKTFLVVRNKGDGATGIYWIEATDVAKHPSKCRKGPPQQIIFQSQMLIAQRFINPVLDKLSTHISRREWNCCVDLTLYLNVPYICYVLCLKCLFLIYSQAQYSSSCRSQFSVSSSVKAFAQSSKHQ